ncbi:MULTISPECIES: helix-turn-helix domain-containing protein [Flavobacterium]|uniref:Transcriptional regulator n=1 Tax=Flavobacterium commune TaxID=1306519 RepID=A0A1D9PD53_9FLAO|nr:MULTISPECIES: helix-turn-helix transcriptional regulator [Flavobacterium]APA00482.1 transcriptional regulator [Flavobacterium commune]
MVNTDDFIKRLEIILDYYSINASAFADRIGVQRSSLSHLLSGRNKPSLDFILKILDVYPEVDLYWILNGKGDFPKNNLTATESESTINSTSIPLSINPNPAIAEDLFSKSIIEETKTTLPQHSNEMIKNLFEEDIEKIVFFYKDGTFKTFNPNQKK